MATRWVPGALAAAALTGLLSSTVSTLATQLTGRRIGRDPSLSWAEVALLLGRRKIEARPSRRTILPGVLIHQAADMWWTIAFFGILAKWTSRLTPKRLLPALPAWAALTSAFEYYVALPWVQPWLIMQTPYWIALPVHLSSAATYPSFYLVRSLVAGRRQRHEEAGRATLAIVGVGLGLLALPAAMGALGRELRWPFKGRDGQTDRDFMVDMAHHHEVGVELANLAAPRATRPDLRDLGRLMAAGQAVEIDVLRRWWQAWFGGDLPKPSEARMRTMPGMPTPEAMRDLHAAGDDFDARFCRLMIDHHQGALAMAAVERRRGSDPRLRLFAAQILHTQAGQIEQMHAWLEGVTGLRERTAGASVGLQPLRSAAKLVAGREAVLAR